VKYQCGGNGIGVLLCDHRVYKKGVKKGYGGKNTHGEGGGGFKEVVGLPTSPQQGGA
jgi:hypothetical protein